MFVASQGGIVPAVLAQEHEGARHPCAYLSKTLVLVAQALPACLRAIAASTLMVTDAGKIVFSHPLILHSPH